MTLQTLAVQAAASCPPLDADRAALFLDLDGTLAPLAPRPEDVRAEPELTALLRRLGERLDGRLAVVSGRTVAELDQILEGAAPNVAGVHGLERRTMGGLTRAAPAPGLAAVRAELDRLDAELDGIHIEDKTIGLALHYRQAPSAEPRIRALARRLAAEHGLELQLGSMVAELKTPGSDKGSAVRAFMAEPPFAGAAPVFVGDDLTDEHGFEAADALGGYGVLVASDRPSAARDHLPDVAAVRRWLAAAL